MKYYDPNTDTIYGCKKGTLSYYHEEGHRRQMKSGMMSRYEMYQRWVMYFFFLCVAWYSELLFLEILVCLIVSFEVFLEIDAWIYAFNKKWSENGKTKTIQKR